MGTATARFRTRGIGSCGQTVCCPLPAFPFATSLAGRARAGGGRIAMRPYKPRPASLFPSVLFPCPTPYPLPATHYPEGAMTDDRLPRPDIHATGASSESDARTAGPERAAALTGIDFNEIRTGEDTRQRGWFWHWNELHTEYGPLLQHSGIGLITSYIVWTDRREHSPYPGYAFPSLQTPAAFSGSDRAELITINPILVALDLIEIRKEMISHTNERGHKLKTPHNLYRVKDRSGDPHLTRRDVVRVLELAAARNDVYRHIRHVLSPGFQPISRTNIWHR